MITVRVFSVSFTVVFRKISTEQTKREESERINKAAQKGLIVTERIFSER